MTWNKFSCVRSSHLYLYSAF